MKEFWDERYREPLYAYGLEPNAYLKEELDKLSAGRILFPAEGEGRNAVYAATLGWDVVAFDQSTEAGKKALMLAANKGVHIDYRIGEFMEVPFAPGQFDAIGLIYAHFPPDLKVTYHRKLAEYLRPGGIIIIETFSRQHAAYQLENPTAGGPKHIGLLDTAEELKEFYSGFEEIYLNEQEIFLNEGLYHQGKAHVVRFTGRKSLP